MGTEKPKAEDKPADPKPAAEEKKEEKKDDKKPAEKKKEEKPADEKPKSADDDDQGVFGGEDMLSLDSGDPYYDPDFQTFESNSDVDYACEERKAFHQPLRAVAIPCGGTTQNLLPCHHPGLPPSSLEQEALRRAVRRGEAGAPAVLVHCAGAGLRRCRKLKMALP